MLSEQALGWLEPAIRENLKKMELNGCWLLCVFADPKYGLLIRRKTIKLGQMTMHDNDTWTVEGAECQGLDATWTAIKAKLAG